jgi:hypothetical protein
MKKMGFEKPKKEKVAKIALNRLTIPKTEPPKWYSKGVLYSYKPHATKVAADILRKKECQFAKIVRKRTEDGTMWEVYTYPEIKPPARPAGW